MIIDVCVFLPFNVISILGSITLLARDWINHIAKWVDDALNLVRNISGEALWKFLDKHDISLFAFPSRVVSIVRNPFCKVL